MSEPSAELRDLLSQVLLESSYDPSSLHREKFLIDHLVEKLEEWETGDITRADLDQTFARHLGDTFDLGAFMDRMVAAGEYFPDEPNPT